MTVLCGLYRGVFVLYIILFVLLVQYIVILCGSYLAI